MGAMNVPDPLQLNPYASGTQICYDFLNLGYCRREQARRGAELGRRNVREPSRSRATILPSPLCEQQGQICRYRHLDASHPEAGAYRAGGQAMGGDIYAQQQVRLRPPCGS